MRDLSEILIKPNIEGYPSEHMVGIALGSPDQHTESDVITVREPVTQSRN